MDHHPWITSENSPSGNTLTQYDIIDIHDPNNTIKPSIVTMVGRRSKTVILESMLKPQESIAVHRQIYLRLSRKANGSDPPFLFIDCGIPRARTPPYTTSKIQERTSSSWNLPLSENIPETLCSRIFAPFSSIIVLFASDLGGQRVVAEWLARQLVSSAPSDLPIAPLILIVVETKSRTFDEDTAAAKIISLVTRFMSHLSGHNNDQASCKENHFSGVRNISIMGLPSSLPTRDRAKVFKKRLLQLSLRADKVRKNMSVQFSLTHFQALSKQALSHWAQGSVGKPFAFARGSRPNGFSTDLLASCVKDFIDQMPSQSWLWHVAIPLIASSLFMSSYPPGAHCKC